MGIGSDPLFYPVPLYFAEIILYASCEFYRAAFPAIKILVGPSAPPIMDTLPALLPISASPIPK